VIVRTGTAGDAAPVAELHRQRIDEGFLSSLGPVFLRRLYRRAARSPHAFVLVADDGGRVVGFAAASPDLNRFYRTFLVRDGLVAVVGAAPRLMRSWPRVRETLRYRHVGGGSGRDLPGAEILAVAVEAGGGRRGTGRALVAAATTELARRGVPAVKVVTAAANTPAIRLYERCGFTRRTRIAVHEGTPSEVMVWTPS